MDGIFLFRIQQFHVADLHLIACFDLPPVYAHALGVAGIVGNASALYEP